MTHHEEYLEVVDISGRVIGKARRSELHRNPSLIHRVVHVIVSDKQGNLLLQKRSMNKDVAPGRWDTSVGGHVQTGEDVHTAALREMREELGIEGCDVDHLYHYLFINHHEAELVTTFFCTYEGEIIFNNEEIDAITYWDTASIKSTSGKTSSATTLRGNFLSICNTAKPSLSYV